MAMPEEPTPPPPFVEVSNLVVEFRSKGDVVRALDDVSLTVAGGDFVTIVGPSGCGKSTLLQVIAGFVHPTSGSVSHKGLPIEGPGPERGIVFQQPALFPWATVFSNAEFGPRVRGVPRSVRRPLVERHLQMVGLWEFRERYPYQLSGGMQHRLAIVRALVNQPSLLLMDEPFAALDALTREHMQDELRQIWQDSGMSVIFVTHSVEEAAYLGTSVIAMSPRPGRIIDRFDLNFSQRESAFDGRAVRSTPEFVAARERILGLIWREGH